MDTINQLEQKLAQLQRLGYAVRYDWFGGTGGGACQLGNQKCLFLDLALGAHDHLHLVDEVLQSELPGSAQRAA